jgi:hypothetical protein
MNVYLFEKNINPLQIQKNNRELETIIQECILTSIRESIPTEAIIRAYMDESVEQDEEVIIENLDEPASQGGVAEVEAKPSEETPATITANAMKEEYEKPAIVPAIQDLDNEPVITRLSFNDYDSVLDTTTNSIESVNAPKTIERLEEISASRALQRKLDEEEEEENDRIHIHTEPIDLSGFEVLDAGSDTIKISTEDPLIDFEEL